MMKQFLQPENNGFETIIIMLLRITQTISLNIIIKYAGNKERFLKIAAKHLS